MDFEDQVVDWDRVRTAELYDYVTDPQGNVNVADVASYSDVRDQLRVKLREGWWAAKEPTTGKHGT